MKILALEVERDGVRPEDFAPWLEAEARAVWELRRSGWVRAVWFRADQKTAVLELEAESLAEAEARLEGLPLVSQGLIHFELIPLAPYTGFERLFRDGEAERAP